MRSLRVEECGHFPKPGTCREPDAFFGCLAHKSRWPTCGRNLFMLVRFCLLRHDAYSHSPQGVFQAAFELRDSGQLEPYEEEWLERDMAWLRMHLPAPECLRDDDNHRAICWFKPTASHAIDKVRGIVALLDSRDVVVRMITTANPGSVVYEDRWQVVAKPWRGRSRLRSRLPSRSRRL